jgi:pantoate--beta-alanine ligase
MIVCETIDAVRAAVAEMRGGGASVGLVPTMGALHAGHMELVRRARAENDRVVASIFVNPAQFEQAADFDLYPRDPQADLDSLRAAGVNAVFLPGVATIYPDGWQTSVDVGPLGRVLMGRIRPGHFRGVATVVTKLFNICRPDRAYFGEKDYQQVQVVRRLVADLDMGLEIVAVPTVREPDGLAMSSRNRRLSPEDRAAATVLCRALDAAEALAADGPVTAARLRTAARDVLAAEPRAAIQSVDVRDAGDLGARAGPLSRPAVILLAVRFGEVLLIDQRVVAPKPEEDA